MYILYTQLLHIFIAVVQLSFCYGSKQSIVCLIQGEMP